jgi:transposase
VLGVDDFALRRGYRYGTVLVDVAASEVIDVLPDRTTGTLSTWLAAGRAPQFICRDRGGEYARGARQGAPDAIQIADRFHLARNSGRALEQVQYRHAAALRKCMRADLDIATSTVSEPMAGPIAQAGARAGRLARYEHVLAL